MKTIILMLLTISNIAMADNTSSEWFCTQESGKREGNIIWSCGIGEALDEGGARHNALVDAQREFQMLCEMSADCNGKTVNVDPQRTSCKPHNGHIKCYRLLVITLKP